MDTNRLIDDLSAGLTPVKAAARPYAMAMRWLLGFTLYGALILAFSSLRPDLMTKLHEPMFVGELALLLAITMTATLSAAVLSFPDTFQRQRLAMLPVGLFALFAVLIAYGLVFGTHAPTPASAHAMECTLCITGYALLPGIWLFYSMRQLASTHYAFAGGIASLSAFSMGALLLRLSEQTDSMPHLLQFHYLPMLAVMVIGMGVGKVILKW